MNPTEYLTAAEAAEYLRLRPQLLAKWRHYGQGPAYFKPSAKTILYLRETWTHGSSRRDATHRAHTIVHVRKLGCMSEFADMPGMAAPLMPTDPVSLAGLDCSDRGNAARFVARYGDRFLFVRAQGWYAFTGSHWTRQGAEAITLNAASATVAAIVDEAKALEDAAKRHDASLSEERAAAMTKRAGILRKWATRAGSITRMKGLLSVAEAKLTAELEDFDKDPHTLNCPNGTVRFVKRGEDNKWEARLDPHDRADRIARITAFAYDASAEAPEWTAHLEKMVPDGRERRYLQRQMGYCALGTTREQCFFMHQGRGGDGKSVTFNTVRRVLGSYATTADIKTFLDSKSGRGGAEASPDLARLAGATRLVCTEEPPRGARLNEGLIKLFTGGAPILARNLNKDPFEFLPRGKIVMQVNPRPHIGGADEGIWRRIKIMLWRVQLQRKHENPAMVMDPDLENRLVDREGAGVLDWIVWGALVYLTAGELLPPETVEEAIGDYKRSSNVIGEWMGECLVREGDAIELMADLPILQGLLRERRLRADQPEGAGPSARRPADHHDHARAALAKGPPPRRSPAEA